MTTLQTTVSPTSSARSSISLAQHWQHYMTRLAYQNNTAEAVSIFLFVSGILLWEAIPLDWAIARWTLIAHLLVGLIIFPLTTGLFWLAHRRLMLTSQKKRLRTTGRMLDIIIAICFASGLVLTFLGNTGNLLGSLTSDAHWLSGLILGPIMLIHAWRYSVLRLNK